jgi:hypothetical protein
LACISATDRGAYARRAKPHPDRVCMSVRTHALGRSRVRVWGSGVLKRPNILNRGWRVMDWEGKRTRERSGFGRRGAFWVVETNVEMGRKGKGHGSAHSKGVLLSDLDLWVYLWMCGAVFLFRVPARSHEKRRREGGDVARCYGGICVGPWGRSRCCYLCMLDLRPCAV